MKHITIKFTGLLLLVVLLLMATSDLIYAANDDIPRVSIEELKRMMDDGADVVILDTQPRSTYDRGHIMGALSLPWVPELKDTDVQWLSKQKLIITYCDCGPGENDSADLASQLIDLGFANVKVLADPSIRGWKKVGYPIGNK